MPSPPSGEQYELRHGDHHAVVVAVGGGLRAYAVAGRAVADGYDASAMADGARGQTLAPWPNRVRDGSWTWQGEQRQLSLTEPEQHNAIHGLVRWLAWQPVDHSDSSIELGCRVVPQPGYPWELTVRNLWSVGVDGLQVRTRITNDSDQPVPVACGFHPYVTVGTATVDTAVLQVPADTYLPTGEQQIPTGRVPVEGTPYDFRTPRPIGTTKLDYTFTDLHRGDDDRCRLILRAPEGETTVTVWTDPAYPYLELFTGDALPDAGRRRQGLGVEPMSCPPNGLAAGQDVVTLQPGASWEGRWGIDPRP